MSRENRGLEKVHEWTPRKHIKFFQFPSIICLTRAPKLQWMISLKYNGARLASSLETNSIVRWASRALRGIQFTCKSKTSIKIIICLNRVEKIVNRGERICLNESEFQRKTSTSIVLLAFPFSSNRFPVSYEWSEKNFSLTRNLWMAMLTF